MEYAQAVYKRELNEYRSHILELVSDSENGPALFDDARGGMPKAIADVLSQLRTGPERIVLRQGALISESLLTPIDSVVNDVGGILSVYRPVVLEAERLCLLRIDDDIEKRARVIWAARLCRQDVVAKVMAGKELGGLLVSTAPNPTLTNTYEALQRLMLTRLSAAVSLATSSPSQKKKKTDDPVAMAAQYDTVADFMQALQYDADIADQQVVSTVALEYNAVLAEVERVSRFEVDQLLTILDADVGDVMAGVVDDYRSILQQHQVAPDSAPILSAANVKQLATHVAGYASDRLDRIEQLFAKYLQDVPVFSNVEFRALMKPRTLELAVNSPAGVSAMRFFLLFRPIIGSRQPSFAKYSSTKSYQYGSAQQYAEVPMFLVHLRISEYAMEGQGATTMDGRAPTDVTLDALYNAIAKLTPAAIRPQAMAVDPLNPAPVRLPGSSAKAAAKGKAPPAGSASSAPAPDGDGDGGGSPATGSISPAPMTTTLPSMLASAAAAASLAPSPTPASPLAATSTAPLPSSLASAAPTTATGSLTSPSPPVSPLAAASTLASAPVTLTSASTPSSSATGGLVLPPPPSPLLAAAFAAPVPKQP